MQLPLATAESVDDLFPPEAAPSSERSGTSNRKESTASRLLPASNLGDVCPARLPFPRTGKEVTIEASMKGSPASRGARFSVSVSMGCIPAPQGPRQVTTAKSRDSDVAGRLGSGFRAVKAPARLAAGDVSPPSWFEPHAASSMLGKTDSVPLYPIHRCFQSSAAVFPGGSN